MILPLVSSPLRRLSYPVFPLILVLLGYGLLGVAICSFLFSMDYSDPESLGTTLVGSIGFLAIGMMMITFRARFTIDATSKTIHKEYRVFGGRLSTEKIRIPENPEHIVILPKKKMGKGYVNAVVPFRYPLKSYDVFIAAGSRRIPIIKTDRKRAVKIADLIRSEISLEYIMEE
jgi:hypothetical protein